MKNIKDKNTKVKKVKYNYDNPESQKLFSEMTVLLADITKHVEKEQNFNVRNIPARLFNIAKRIKNKLKSFLK